MSGAILIAGTQSGVGKTTVTMGILAAFSKRKTVQAYKTGPDYIDPAYHTFITGRISRNLDNYLLSDDCVRKLFFKNLKGADLAVIEGAMGLFDGSVEDHKKGSAAGIAKTIGCPVVLVVDGSGMSMSGAALVDGYANFDKELQLRGVIFNRVNSQSHYELLKSAVEAHTKVRCFGYLSKNMPSLPSRHLGLVPSCEIEALQEKIEVLAEAVEDTIDLDGLEALASTFRPGFSADHSVDNVRVDDCIETERSGTEERFRIGVAKDAAFNFYYEDNLDFFREQGADIVYFSPLDEKELPKDLSFLYFGGGYPEQFASRLSENIPMKKSIITLLESGIPYLAECGGLMYLSEAIVDFDGNVHTMLEWLPGRAVMTKKLVRFGYKQMVLMEDCLLGEAGTTMKIHEFHHSELIGGQEPTIYQLVKVRKGKETIIHHCGYKKGNGIAGYPHLHLYSNPEVGTSIVKHIKNYERYMNHSNSTILH